MHNTHSYLEPQYDGSHEDVSMHQTLVGTPSRLPNLDNPATSLFADASAYGQVDEMSLLDLGVS